MTNVKNQLLMAKLTGKELGVTYQAGEPDYFKLTFELPTNVGDNYSEIKNLIENDEDVFNHLLSLHQIEIYGEELIGNDKQAALESIMDTIEIENNQLTFDTLYLSKEG